MEMMCNCGPGHSWAPDWQNLGLHIILPDRSAKSVARTIERLLLATLAHFGLKTAPSVALKGPLEEAPTPEIGQSRCAAASEVSALLGSATNGTDTLDRFWTV